VLTVGEEDFLMLSGAEKPRLSVKNAYKFEFCCLWCIGVSAICWNYAWRMLLTGDSSKGVFLCKHADVHLKAAALKGQEICWLFMFLVSLLIVVH